MSFSHAVIAAPAPVGALTIGATEAGLALVLFGDRPEAAVRAGGRIAALAGLGVAPSRHAGSVGAPSGADELSDSAGASDPAAAQLTDAVAQVQEYLDDARRAFDVPIDWRLTTGNQRRVLQSLYDTVPFGRTVTYGELGSRSGLGAGHTVARGVGSIMGSNPIPVVVPCHRVLGADGLGGFGGGLATKEWLLALEGVLTPTLDLF